ncbi:MAG: hypothetical protein M3083_07060 [Actinomycetota bacterium]|nr:hypothetical protein [Actinomycetota bacterium]MDQ6946783.1 hypothetical protein [Actinomycetota bacterium]
MTDPFAHVVAELSDGQRWALLRAEGWDDFVERLSDLIVHLPGRRRQALLMLLFALVHQQLTPEAAKAWLDQHDVDRDEGIEAMIGWLRQFRPPRPPDDMT